MSQAGSLLNVVLPGGGIQTVTGNNGIPVGPDGVGDVQIIGVGDITVTGDALTNTLQITSAGLATTFHTDVGDAVPAAGIINIHGTVNEIETEAVLADSIQISLSSDVVIDNDLDVTNDLIVNNDLNVAGDVLIAGSLGCNLIIGSVVTGTAGLIAAAGGIYSNGPVIMNDALLLPGIMQVDAVHNVFSNNGANGQIFIGGGAAPTWANITSTGGSILVTSGANTINLEVGGIAVTEFWADNATHQHPVGNRFNIYGDANISTTAPAAQTLRVNLNPNVTITGAFSANGITSTGAIAATGNISSNTSITTTGTITATGAISGGSLVSIGGITAGGLISTSGNITALGDIAAAGSIAATGSILSTTRLFVQSGGCNITGPMHIVDATLPRGVVQINGTQDLYSSNATANGQVLIGAAGGATNPVWNTLTAGPGIAITNTANHIQISTTGVGATVAFTSYLATNVPNVTGEGTEVFLGATGSAFTTISNYGAAFTPGDGIVTPARFTAPTNGVYHFEVQLLVYNPIIASYQPTATTKLYVNGGLQKTFNTQSHIFSTFYDPAYSSTFYIYPTTLYLNAGSIVAFSFTVSLGVYKRWGFIGSARTTCLSGFRVS